MTVKSRFRTRAARPKTPFLFLFLAGVFQTPAWAQDKPAADALPVKAVTLFSSGVSYTQREGSVEGDATVPIAFRTAQINDILKSLTLLDAKGTVQPAIYGAKDPIGRTLQSFAVDVTQPLDRASLLNRLRGARVKIETDKGAITGQIVGVETKSVTIPNAGTTTLDILTILSDAGLQSVRLDETKSIQLLDEKLNREFREALTLLTSGADDKRRTVTLHFAGKGRREVKVGYISEAPLWKVSYRLLVSGTGPGGGAKPFLQGWALVENTTDDDWNGVQLSLISGRPVSFIQDLYQPLYLPRPVVPPDVVASPFPQVAEGAIEQEGLGVMAEASDAPAAVPAASAKAVSRVARQYRTQDSFGVVNGAAGGLSGGEGRGASFAFNNAIRQSVTAQASGEKSGELFRYDITTPVNLPRQQAAMIPIITRDLAGEKVSLYNADSDPRFPLNAFRLRNTSALHLKGGPVTLFDEGTYAGDARMEDIPPGDSRLITYAVDLGVEGDRKQQYQPTERIGLIIRRGVMTISRNNRSETNYTLKNRDSRPRTVLVEQPYTAEWKLIEPEKPAERTPNLYRFSVSLAAGATEKLKVVMEMPISEQLALLNGDVNSLQYYVARGETPESVKAVLREAMARRNKILNLRAQAGANDAALAEIEKDQDRIRKNMGALDKNSALYQRYVRALDDQETKMQGLRKEAARLRNAAAEAEAEFGKYLEGINIGG